MSQIYYDSGPAAQGQKVMLATTAYDSPDASYTFSIQKTRSALAAAAIQSEYLLLSGNCHVDDARNVVVQQFLLSDCTDLLFIDADVSWSPANVLTLLAYDCDLVGGVYPFRREASDKANMPVRMIEGVFLPDEGLLEVEGLPAGFMRMRRVVPETLAKTADHYRNRADYRSDVPILFERTFDTGTRWGGDLNFCRKWMGAGGKVFAAYEMRLGHTAKTVVHDSLGAALRRQQDMTLRHVADEIRGGSTDIQLFREARRYCNNTFGALEDVLSVATIMARQAKGPIIEAGSGLSTIVMAAANPDQTVYCLEHDPVWSVQLEAMAHKAGTLNIGMCLCPMKDGWYDLAELDLPDEFALGVNDGPPRQFGSRMGFYEHFGDRCAVIVADDADDPGYRGEMEAWTGENGRAIDYVDTRAALIRPLQEKAA